MFSYSTLVYSSVVLLIQYHVQEYVRLDRAVMVEECEGSPTPRVDVYDFIIVGGGTAGCVLASRLSKPGAAGNGRNFSVLLLEAGGNPPPQLSVPGYIPFLPETPEITHQYKTVPQKRAGLALFEGQRMDLRAGRVLGGGSSINDMYFNRGHPRDYERWEEITGDESWSYANVLKYFKRVEHYAGEFPDPADQHGFDGPVTVSKDEYTPGIERWIAAGVELGYPNVDPNGPQQKTVGRIEVTKRAGKRVSSYTAYLKDVETGRRGNLKISRYSTATEIVFDGTGKKAEGVAYNRHGILHYAKAAKEVIISAGSYESPKLLLRSGVGPGGWKHNLPVGQRLLDHPIIPLQIVLNDSSLALDPDRDLTEETLKLYQNEGLGPLSSGCSFPGQVLAVSRVSEAEGFGDWPDIQFHVYHSAEISLLPLPEARLKPGEVILHLLVYLGRPRSSGSLKVDPANPEKLLIDPDYNSDSKDFEIFIDGLKKALELFEGTRAYQEVGARYPTESLQECEGHEFRSDAYWRCYISQLTFSGFHAAGTCGMGKVVDSKLNVIGMKGLRVIDASIMPEIVNANLQAPVYMIAEKGAEEILRKWRAGEKQQNTEL